MTTSGISSTVVTPTGNPSEGGSVSTPSASDSKGSTISGKVAGGETPSFQSNFAAEMAATEDTTAEDIFQFWMWGHVPVVGFLFGLNDAFDGAIFGKDYMGDMGGSPPANKTMSASQAYNS